MNPIDSKLIKVSRINTGFSATAAQPTGYINWADNKDSYEGGASGIWNGNLETAQITDRALANNIKLDTSNLSASMNTLAQLLQAIANNTIPIAKILEAVLALKNAGLLPAGGESGIPRTGSTTPHSMHTLQTQQNVLVSSKVDDSFVSLVGLLADIAKG